MHLYNWHKNKSLIVQIELNQIEITKENIRLL